MRDVLAARRGKRIKLKLTQSDLNTGGGANGCNKLEIWGYFFVW